MFELTVATALCCLIPAIVMDQAQDISGLQLILHKFNLLEVRSVSMVSLVGYSEISTTATTSTPSSSDRLFVMA